MPVEGSELRRLRLARGLTQREVADELGVTQSMISQIETEKRRVPLGEDSENPDPEWNGLDVNVLLEAVQTLEPQAPTGRRGPYGRRRPSTRNDRGVADSGGRSEWSFP